MSDVELYFSINKILSFHPDNFDFPVVNNRSFQKSWMKKFPWLCYSKTTDGAFCISCAMFGHRFPDKTAKMKRLYSIPYKTFSRALDDFRSHQSTKNNLHQFTFPVYSNFCRQMSGKSQPINIMVDAQISSKIKSNRLILKSIVDTVIYCARANTSFRGHRDDFHRLPQPGSWSSENIGVFNQTLNYAVRNGNTVLENHLSNCSKNATYISKTTQNDLIKCCGDEISDQILTKVKTVKFFSILADEACDISTKEQMSVVLRCVDEKGDIKEDFIRFEHCSEGLSGKDLCSVILKCLGNDLGLDILNCRGQGYDGAGSVSGYINGLSAHILRLNHKALYTHCHSHRLNLSVCDSCNIPIVSDLFNKVRETSDFFNSSETRLRFFESKVIETVEGSKSVKLKNVCRTRWIERIDGLTVFLNNFSAILKSFDEMMSGNSFNRDTKVKAASFFKCLASFYFIFPLVVVTHSLELTLPVTRLLQGRSLDILQGTHLINSLKTTFSSMRTDIDDQHDIWYKEAETLAHSLDIEVTKSRTCGKQTQRVNVPSQTVSSYYKRAVTAPFLDHITSSLNNRFQPESVNVYKGFAIIPSNMKHLKESFGCSWKEQFKEFSIFYEDDFLNYDCLDGELCSWDTYWSTYKGKLPDSISSTLKSIPFPSYENIKVALRILGTLPVTSCECERSFSSLRRLKDYTRNTMTADRLNGLALMYVHREIVPDIEKVIDRFSQSNRRLEF